MPTVLQESAARPALPSACCILELKLINALFASLCPICPQLGMAEIRNMRSVAWYRRPSFWGRLLSFSLSLAFFLTGIVTLFVWPDVVSLAGGGWHAHSS